MNPWGEEIDGALEGMGAKTRTPAAGSTELFQALLLLGLLGQRLSPAMMVLLISPTTLALYNGIAAAKGKLGGSPIWTRVGLDRLFGLLSGRQSQATQMATRAEILALFVVVLEPLLRYRANFVFGFMLYTWLRMRYFAPDSQAQHQQAWAWLDEVTRPLRSRFPIVEIPLGYIKRNFLSLGEQMMNRAARQ